MCIWLRHDMLSYEEFTFYFDPCDPCDPTLRVFGMVFDIGFSNMFDRNQQWLFLT